MIKHNLWISLYVFVHMQMLRISSFSPDNSRSTVPWQFRCFHQLWQELKEQDSTGINSLCVIFLRGWWEIEDLHQEIARVRKEKANSYAEGLVA